MPTTKEDEMIDKVVRSNFIPKKTDHNKKGQTLHKDTVKIELRTLSIT
jgi:hypothetical protein